MTEHQPSDSLEPPARQLELLQLRQIAFQIVVEETLAALVLRAGKPIDLLAAIGDAAQRQINDQRLRHLNPRQGDDLQEAFKLIWKTLSQAVTDPKRPRARGI